MIHFLKTNHVHGVYNSSEMGLGKSIMTVASLAALDLFPSLIICPAVVRLNWRNEILKWLPTIHPHISPQDIHVCTRLSSPLPDSPLFLVVSYDYGRDSTALLTPEYLSQFKSLILDECHYLKTTTSKRTRRILGHIWPHIPYRVCLSGTPFTQSIMDAYTLFHRLAPHDFPDWHDFAARFSYQTHTPFGVKYHGLKNPEHLRRVIREKFFVRYQKKDVLPELPAKRWIKISLDASYIHDPTDPAAHKRFLLALRAHYADPARVPFPRLPTHIATHRRVQTLKKLRPIVEFLRDISPDIPTVFFGYHTEFIRKIRDNFRDKKPSFVDGSTSPKDRDLAISRFQNGDTNLFIGQFTAAGVGINLTRASTCVLGEMDWSPATLGQAISRIDRIGQKNSIDIYYFVVDNSLEDDILDTLIDKAVTFNEALTS